MDNEDTTSTQDFFLGPENWVLGYYSIKNKSYHVEDGYVTLKSALSRLDHLNRMNRPLGVQSINLKQIFEPDLPTETQLALDELDELFQNAVANDE